MTIEITGAVYATEKKGIDVTEIIRKLVNKNLPDIYVTNSAMGEDPDPGTRKTLTILYKSHDGSSLAIACNERETLQVPHGH